MFKIRPDLKKHIVNHPKLDIFLASIIILISFTLIAFYAATPSLISPLFWTIYIFKLILGIISLIIIPGYFLALLIKDDANNSIKLGFSTAIGFMLQMANVFILYMMQTFLKYSYVNFLFFIAIITFFELSFLFILYSFKANKLPVMITTIFDKKNFKLEPIYLILASGIILRLVYQSIISNILAPDGALYLDIGRYIVSTGQTSSLIINDGFQFPYINVAGLTPHIGTPFAMSLFFLVGNISYLSGKIMAVFVGSLLIYLVYDLTTELFNRKVALFASILLAFNPFYIFFSSVLFGPEIISCLFLVLTIFFATRSSKNGGVLLPILTGLSMFIAIITWNTEFPILLIILATVFAINAAQTRLRHFTSFFIFLFVIALMFIALQLSAKLNVWIILITVLFLILGILIILKVKNSVKMAIASIAFIIFIQIFFFRSYFTPEAYLTPASSSQGVKAVSIFINISADKFLNNFLQLYKPAVELYLGAPLVVLAFLSLVTIRNFKSKWIFGAIIISHVLLYSFYYTNTYFDARMLLSLGIGLIVLTSLFACVSLPQLISPIKRVKKIDFNSFYVLLIILILLLPSFLTTFNQNSQFINQYSSDVSEIVDLSNYIDGHTSPKDILLSTGSPRVIAWFANRTVVGLSVFKNSTAIPPNEIEPSDLNTLLIEYNVAYIVADSTIYGFEYPNLNLLFSQHNLGESVPVEPGNELTVSEVYTNAGAILYKVENSSLENLWSYKPSLMLSDNRGNLTTNNNVLDITTSQVENWGATAYYDFERNFTLPVSSFLTVNISKASSTSEAAVLIKFSDGTTLYQQFTSPGTYYADLAAFLGKTPSRLFLYCLLNGVQGSYSTSYNYVSIRAYEEKVT